jgi:PAS domain S-box-containing protein
VETKADTTRADVSLPRVLVVEDEAETRAILCELLRDEYTVLAAANGREGLELLRRFHPDVVLMDLFMPVMSGEALITAIRAERAWSELPILIMSVRGEEELRLHLIDTAVQDYLIKPFSERELRIRLKNLVCRKLSEEERRHTEMLLSEAEAIAHIGSYDWDVRSGEMLLSRELLRIFGLDPERRRLLRSEFVAYVHPEDQPRLAAAVDEGLRERRGYEVEVRILRRDGLVRTLHTRTRMMLDPEGQVAHIIGIIQDVTEQKDAEQALRLNEVIVRNMAEGVCLVRARDRQILHANPKFKRMFGYDPGELTGQSVSILNGPLPDAPPEEVTERIFALLWEGGGEATYEIVNRRKDGTLFLCRATTTIIDDPEHGPVLVAVQEDITERKRASEMALRLASIVESTSDAVLSKSLDGIIESWNAAAQRLYGWASEEIVGRPVTVMIPPDRIDEEREMRARVRRGDRIENVETVRLCKDGRRIEVSLTTSPIRDAKGHVISIAVIARDISEAKRAERALKASLEEKEVLLREIHHRVKNNLQVISSLLSLQARAISDEKARQELAESRGRVRSIALLHERLYQSKDLARIDMGTYARELLASLLQTYALQGAVAIEVHSDGVFLGIDVAVPVGLVLNELVTNSLKHAFPPGVPSAIARPWIRVEFHREAGEVALLVHDNGVGLPMGAAEAAKPKSFGLELVRMLARQLDATFVIETNGGTRATFRLKTPTAQV